MPAPTRQWPKDELARMRTAVESGIERRVIAARFQCSTHTINGLAGHYGWTIPRQRVAKPKRFKVAVDKKGWRAVRKGNPGNWLKIYHDPDDLCGGRRLQGAEFQKRKRELEARELAASARR